VKRVARAASTRSIDATAKSGSEICGSVALRGAPRDSEGRGRPSDRRARAVLAILALVIAAFAITAAPASAAPLATKMEGVSDISYASAAAKGKVSSPCAGFCGTSWEFQYATSESGPWSPGPGGFISGVSEPAVENKSVEGNFEGFGLKGGTEYFLRLSASTFFEEQTLEAVDPTAAPYQSFTTLAVDPPVLADPVTAGPVLSTSATATSMVTRPANADPAFDVSCHYEYVTDEHFSTEGFTGATVRQCGQNSISPDKVNGEGKAEVTAPLGCTSPLIEPAEECLEPSTSYHLRLVAENGAPGFVTKEAASTFTTATKVAPPSVIVTDDASEVAQNTAKVTGEVQRPAGADPALNTECRFEYVTDQQFTDAGFEGALIAPCAENPITGEAPADVSAGLGGLKPNTTYHLRLAAENDGGSDIKIAADTFTTIAAELPIVTIDPVEGGTYTTAHVSGTVNIDDPGQSNAPTRIDFSTDEVNWSPFEVPTPSGTGPLVVQHDFTGLQPSSTYFFRIISKYSSNSWEEGLANGEVAFSPEPNPSITTGELFPPTAEGLEVSEITGSSARFTATVDPHTPAGPLNQAAKNAFASHWEFTCTPECKDANGNTIEGTVQAEEGPQSVTGLVKRLEPGAHYEVTLLIHSEGGDGSEVEPFDTLAVPPTVKSTPGGSDGEGGYTLQGLVNPNNHQVTGCEFKWGPTAPNYAFSATCSPMPVSGSKPLTVEAHLDSLNPDVKYHALLVVTYDAGTKATGVDQEFEATLKQPEICANEQVRRENNSLVLPECRAYEMVTPPGKEGFNAGFGGYAADGDRVAFGSGAGNILRSGQNGLNNAYVTNRTATGWETIANLNGSSGSVYDAPSEVDVVGPTIPYYYSKDLLKSLWAFHKRGGPDGYGVYLRNPDGTFTEVGPLSTKTTHALLSYADSTITSGDLSHVVLSASKDAGSPEQGPGLYEYLGTGNAESDARRVDVDNSGTPVHSCTGRASDAHNNAISTDGRVIVFTALGHCGNDPRENEIWARVDGATSFNVSASQCDRVAPADPCNAAAEPHFQGMAKDGRRVFFTTTQQLVNEDTDLTNDLYSCDIPAGTPAQVMPANPCSPLRQVSGGASAGADVEGVLSITSGLITTYPGVSDDGSTVYFTATGVLAGNKDALGGGAVAGDHNLYVWRQSAAHPTGQTTFVANLRLADQFLRRLRSPETTPDGRYLIFTTVNQLVATDTDTSADVYRFDADTEELTRVTTNVFGVAGNSDGLDASISGDATSDDGQKIAFNTTEALSPADGNNAPDAYLWTPARVSLISAGSVGSGGTGASIDASGRDIYFDTQGALSPADGDDSGDVYDARVGGGFSFAPTPACIDEGCQPDASPVPEKKQASSTQPSSGNPPSQKPCPKGKVRKHGKCVKKPRKNHGKRNHGKRAAHKRGGGK
jgi:hypothetical protein